MSKRYWPLVVLLVIFCGASLVVCAAYGVPALNLVTGIVTHETWKRRAEWGWPWNTRATPTPTEGGET